MRTDVRTYMRAAAILLSVLVSGVLADSITADGRTWSGAKIQWVQDGRIRFEAADRTQQAVPVASVELLQVDLADAFNRGEQLRRQGQDGQALEAYQAALRTESRSHIANFIRWRLMQLHGRTGDLDKAIDLFVELVAQPDFLLVVNPWRPAKAGLAKPRARETAMARLDEALRQVKTGLASDAIRQMKEYIAAGADEASAQGAVGPDTAPATPADAPASSTLPERAARWFARGEHLQALQAADQMLAAKGLRRDLLEDALYVRGVALWNLAKDQRQVHQAGWALARLVVEFPASRHVPECRYYLALVHVRLGRPDVAVGLLQQVRASAGASSDLQDRAKKAYLDLVVEK